MIREAQSVESARVLSATGFARSNISILHQQLRCANLAWALRKTKRIKRGDVVAIVGGSFSGIMLASALAIANDVVVYLFEKERRLLHRFLDKSHRYLSPNLNARDLGPRFDPRLSGPFFRPPIFRWESGRASDVASQWLREFDRYRSKLPIFVFLDGEVTKQDVQSDAARVRLHPRHFPTNASLACLNDPRPRWADWHRPRFWRRDKPLAVSVGLYGRTECPSW